MDTLRADALSCYGSQVRDGSGAPLTPTLDALAARGVRFAAAYSTAPWTVPGLASQLTGKWPWEHGGLRLTRPLGVGNDTLAERFQRAGWATAGVMTNWVLKGDMQFDQGFERWSDALALGHQGSHGVEAAEQLLAFADELRAAGKQRLFLFLFLFEPHFRYEAHPEFGIAVDGVGDASYAGSLTGTEEINDLLRRRKELTEEDQRFLRSRYQGEVAATDRAIARLVAGLTERGLWDRALVAFSSDHGEEVFDHGWLGHAVHLGEELVRVPFIVRPPEGTLPPGRVGAVVESPVSMIGFHDTLLELAGVEQGAESLAASVLTGAVPERRFLLLHTDFEPPLPNSEEKQAHMWGVIDTRQRLKWIVDHNVPAGKFPMLYLYDLAKDPAERENLAGSLEHFKKTRELWLYRGLLPEPLADRDPSVPNTPPPPTGPIPGKRP